MYALCCKDNSNSLRYRIYTLIITTACIANRGLHCVLFFADSLLHLAPFCSLLLLSIPQAPYALCFFLFFPWSPAGLEPLTFRIPLAYPSPSSTPLNYEVQLRITPRKVSSILRLVIIPKKNTSQFTYSSI